MSARAARGPGSARPKARSQSRGKGGKAGRGATGASGLDGLAGEGLRRIGGWAVAGMIIAVGMAVAVALQLPQKAGIALGEAVGEAGFSVKRVEIKGLERMERLPVYAIALDQESMAMPLVDLDQTRQRLLGLGWVREARVSRRLPDTLVVDIVERRPAAIWQHNRRLALIDIDGVVLESVKLDSMPDLPLVIGPSANRRAAELNRLLDGAPSVKPMMAGATWVGGRRWDLRFQSGEVLALPEGEAAAKKALVHFARMDEAAQLLGRGLVRFDMRIPGKFIVRVSSEPGSRVPDIEPEAPAQVDPRTI